MEQKPFFAILIESITRKISVKLFQFLLVVQVEMSFKDISIFSYCGHCVQPSRTVCEI